MIDFLKFYLSPQNLWAAYFRFGRGAFAVIGVELTLREFLSLFPIESVGGNFGCVIQGFGWYFYVGVPIAIGLFCFIPKRKVSATIAGTDIRVSCKVCDILVQKGDIVISVNTTFDTSTENEFISPKSLQGAFQSKYYGGRRTKKSDLDDEIVQALQNDSPVEIKDDKRKTKRKQYAVGTVAKLPQKKRMFNSEFRPYLIAMATSTASGTTKITSAQFAEAIQKLWGFLAENGEKTMLCVPLLGSGRSGLKCSRMTIAKEIIFSFVAYARSQRIVDELQICISPYDYRKYKMSLDELQDYLNVVSTNDSLYNSCSQGCYSSTPIGE